MNTAIVEKNAKRTLQVTFHEKSSLVRHEDIPAFLAKEANAVNKRWEDDRYKSLNPSFAPSVRNRASINLEYAPGYIKRLEELLKAVKSTDDEWYFFIWTPHEVDADEFTVYAIRAVGGTPLYHISSEGTKPVLKPCGEAPLYQCFDVETGEKAGDVFYDIDDIDNHDKQIKRFKSLLLGLDSYDDVESIPCELPEAFVAEATKLLDKHSKDIMFVSCKECGKLFGIGREEQDWFKEKNFNLPCRCRQCRIKRRNRS